MQLNDGYQRIGAEDGLMFGKGAAPGAICDSTFGLSEWVETRVGCEDNIESVLESRIQIVLSSRVGTLDPSNRVLETNPR